MATFLLVHGAGSDGWYWHRTAAALEARGHEAIAPDLPVRDDSAGLAEYAEVVVEAAAERAGCVLVAQSLAGFTAPLVADRVAARLLVLLNAMIPLPGEPPGEWWANTAWEGEIPESDERIRDVFLHDVPPELAAESADHWGPQSEAPFRKPWPLDEWPDVPTRILAGREDRFFTIDFQRRVAGDRLGLDVDVIGGGHLVALSRPEELAARLDGYAETAEAAPRPRFRR